MMLLRKIAKLLKEIFFACVMVLFVPFLIFLRFLWIFFAYVVNLVGFSHIRKSHNALQTPIVFYENPRTGRKVVVVACIHVAEEEYFDELQKVIDSLVGYKVLFEGVGNVTPEEETKLSPKALRAKQELDKMIKLHIMVCSLLGLKYQKEALTYNNPSWVNVDARMFDVCSRIGEQKIRFLTRKPKLDFFAFFNDEANDSITRIFFILGFKHFLPLYFLSSLVSFFLRQQTKLKKIIIDDRNEVALQGIRRYIDKQNVVTIWGAAHLKGINRGLKKDGFIVRKKIWCTAFDILAHPIKFEPKAQEQNSL